MTASMIGNAVVIVWIARYNLLFSFHCNATSNLLDNQMIVFPHAIIRLRNFKIPITYVEIFN